MNHRIAVTISFLFPVFLLNAYADSIPSNEAIARKLLVDTALEEVYLHATEAGGVAYGVLRDNGENSEMSIWMQQRLVDSTLHAGYSVYMQTEDAPDSAMVVEITNQNITFEYRSIGNKWLFFNNGYSRSVQSDFHILIRKKNGKVLLSQQFRENFTDTVSNINAVENGKLVFTKGKKIKSSLGKRLFEPVLITASTGIMVYLFYSLRSGK